MWDIKIFEEHWGILMLSLLSNRFDIFPRVTLAQFPRAFVIHVGFLFFTLHFTIWSKNMREFNRRCAKNKHK
jgi:hypothetical protein